MSPIGVVSKTRQWYQFAETQVAPTPSNQYWLLPAYSAPVSYLTHMMNTKVKPCILLSKKQTWNPVVIRSPVGMVLIEWVVIVSWGRGWNKAAYISLWFFGINHRWTSWRAGVLELKGKIMNDKKIIDLTFVTCLTHLGRTIKCLIFFIVSGKAV